MFWLARDDVESRTAAPVGCVLRVGLGRSEFRAGRDAELGRDDGVEVFDWGV